MGTRSGIQGWARAVNELNLSHGAGSKPFIWSMALVLQSQRSLTHMV